VQPGLATAVCRQSSGRAGGRAFQQRMQARQLPARARERRRAIRAAVAGAAGSVCGLGRVVLLVRSNLQAACYDTYVREVMAAALS